MATRTTSRSSNTCKRSSIQRRSGNRQQSFLLPLYAALTFLMSLASRAYADGGAPNLAYVAGSQQGISIIDVAKQKVTSGIAVQGDPHTMLLSLDGRFLYVTQPQLEKVAIIAAKTGERICTTTLSGQPTFLALDPSNNTLYAAGNRGPTVTALDATNCKVKRTLSAGGNVQGLAMRFNTEPTETQGNQLWVAAGKSLVIFDGSTGQKLGSITIPSEPEHITIPPGQTAYVTTKQGGIIAVGLTNHDQVALIPKGTYGSMDYDAITGEIYVPDQQSQQLLVLTPVLPGEPLRHEPARTLPLGATPTSVAITSDGQLGFVALQNGDVAMIDIPARQIINTLHVGGSPNFIITGLYPPDLETRPQQTTIEGSTVLATAGAALIIIVFLILLLQRRFKKGTKKRSTGGNERQAATSARERGVDR